MIKKYSVRHNTVPCITYKSGRINLYNSDKYVYKLTVLCGARFRPRFSKLRPSTDLGFMMYECRMCGVYIKGSTCSEETVVGFETGSLSRKQTTLSINPLRHTILNSFKFNY